MDLNPETNPLILIVTLTAMVLLIHLNTSWKMKKLTKRVKELEDSKVSVSMGGKSEDTDNG